MPSSTVPFPATLWPPPRTASRSSCSRASRDDGRRRRPAIARPDDRGRAPVDHAVPDAASVVVAAVIRRDDPAGDLVAQRVAEPTCGCDRRRLTRGSILEPWWVSGMLTGRSVDAGVVIRRDRAHEGPLLRELDSRSSPMYRRRFGRRVDDGGHAVRRRLGRPGPGHERGRSTRVVHRRTAGGVTVVGLVQARRRRPARTP